MSVNRGLEVLNQFREADRPDIILAMCEVEFADLKEGKEGDIEVEGWFITEQLIESRRMVVKTSAFTHEKAMRLFNGRVLAFHDQLKEPVGEVIEMKLIKGKGVRGRVRLYRENSELFKRAIREKKLNAFSIGFTVEKWEYDEKQDVLTVTMAYLKELSVVNIGADSNALFEVRNSLDDVNQPISIVLGGNTLSEKKKEFDVEQFMTEQEQLGTKVTELQELLNSLRDTQTQYADRAITKAEFAQKLEGMSGELNTIKEQVERAKAERTMADHKLAYKDYRSLITDFVWLTDDDGNKLGEIAQKAYCLFQMPVDYDKMEAGYELKNLRDLYDAVCIADAMGRFKARDRYSMHNLKLFKQLVTAVEKFDKDVANAMAAGNTGYGAEWLPEELSSEFAEILRVQPMLPSKFLLWNMPKGGSAKYPFQNGKAVVYKGGEALVDNAEEARKTNIATGVKTFTPDVFIGALVSSEELTEDTVLDMVSFIRTELAKALLEGLESAMINGDDTSTHFDNAGGDSVYETYNVETCFKGLRAIADDDSNELDIEVASASSGVGALEIVNFTNAKAGLGVAGLSPEECIYVTGIKGRTQVQTALYKEDALGVLAFMISGKLPTIDGSEIYISGQYDEQLDSTGVRNSGNDVKHTSMVCAHKPSFRLAQRRGTTLEYNKNVLTQQQAFVATARWDFGKICADAIKPVAGMINIQHTA